MPDLWSKLFSVGEGVVKRAKYGSVVDSLVVVAVTVTPGSFLLCWLTQSHQIISMGALVVGAMPLIGLIWGFVYFAINDPLKLRTEEHEERIIRYSQGLGTSELELAEEKVETLEVVSDVDVEEAQGD